MARPTTRSERGQALLEALPVMSVLIVFVVFIMVATYLIFAKIWLQWQSEQALYCAAVAQGQELSAGSCGDELEKRLAEFLPWGEAHARVWALGADWHVEAKWRWGKIRFVSARELTPRAISGKRDLHW